MSTRIRRDILLLFVLGLLAAPFMAVAAQAADVTVFAAASLKNALDDAAKLYQTKTGDKVTISYAASSALAKQIEAGAPADIFFSADLDWMDYLQEKKLIDIASTYASAKPEARKFLDFLLSPEAAPPFEAQGFSIQGKVG